MNGGRINENEAKVITTDPRYNLRIVATLESISIHSPMLHIRKPPTYKTLTDLIEGRDAYSTAGTATCCFSKREKINSNIRTTQ